MHVIRQNFQIRKRVPLLANSDGHVTSVRAILTFVVFGGPSTDSIRVRVFDHVCV